MELCGRRFDTGEPVCLEIAHGKIARVTPAAERNGAAHWPWIAPGLIDTQFNGYAGQEFSSLELTPDKVAHLVDLMGGMGMTQFCPTVTTERFDVLRHAVQTIAAACDASPAIARRIAAVHLEGPYISAEDGTRGAHPQAHCRPPDWEEFRRLQDAAGGRIRIVTMAAEYGQTPEFIRRAVDGGVVVAIGHTAADSGQIRAAVDAGARMSTHLGNGCPALLPRHPNYVWDQLAEDRLTAGLIADGQHLPPAVLKTFVRVKTPARCILVSDMGGQAGLPPGRYTGRLCEVEVLEDGRLVMAGQTKLLAGASRPIGVGVINLMRLADVTLADAVKMASHHPAAVLGMTPVTLEPGSPADLVRFNIHQPAEAEQTPKFEVLTTVAGGDLVFGGVVSG